MFGLSLKRAYAAMGRVTVPFTGCQKEHNPCTTIDASVLEDRLVGRCSDSSEQIEKRLRVAEEEIRAAGFYSYCLINDSLDKAVLELRSILVAERLRRRGTAALCRRFLAES